MIFHLFGSRYHESHRPNSDIDVWIELADFEKKEIHETFKYFSIEQGGPLDLFFIGSFDNDFDLIAFFSEEKIPRIVSLGDDEDFETLINNSRTITLEELLQMCEDVDPIWQQDSACERIKAKSKAKKL